MILAHAEMGIDPKNNIPGFLSFHSWTTDGWKKLNSNIIKRESVLNNNNNDNNNNNNNNNNRDFNNNTTNNNNSKNNLINNSNEIGDVVSSVYRVYPV